MYARWFIYFWTMDLIVPPVWLCSVICCFLLYHMPYSSHSNKITSLGKYATFGGNIVSCLRPLTCCITWAVTVPPAGYIGQAHDFLVFGSKFCFAFFYLFVSGKDRGFWWVWKHHSDEATHGEVVMNWVFDRLGPWAV